MAARGPRSRYWFFTENDNPEALIPALEIEGLPTGITYVCGQLERGTHLHFQGYLELEVNNRISWLKKNFSPTAHFEKRMGTQEECIHYCSKPHDGCKCKHCTAERAQPTSIVGTFVELGVKTTDKQGKRNDLLEAKSLIEDGADDLQVADECFRSWCQYAKSFTDYRQKLIAAGRLQQKKRGPVTTYVLWGVPGSGKTTTVRRQAGVPDDGGPELFEKAPQSEWWTGYQGQDQILLDEHNSGWLKWDTFMALLNPVGGPLSLPVHGGMVDMLATKVYITCNAAPEDWYKNIDATRMPALWRRLNTGGVFKINKDDHSLTPLPDYSAVPTAPINAIPGYRWN